MKRITIIGNLTSDAEVKDVSNKKAINFAVAQNDKFKDAQGNKQEKTNYYNCVIWRDSNVELAKYLTKGTKVFIEGSPEIEVYKDRQGEMKGAIKIIVGNLELLGGGRRDEGTQTTMNTNSVNTKTDNDDLPF